MLSSFACIQSKSAVVPSVASPSSSPVIVRTTAPSGGVSLTRSTAAAANAATPDFISTAPRPYMKPSFTSAPNGGIVQAASSPKGTTSVWPLKPNVFGCPLSPQRANKFGVPLRSTREQAKPASSSNACSRTNAPPSVGVTDGHRISLAVRSTGSIEDMSYPLNLPVLTIPHPNKAQFNAQQVLAESK